MLYTEKSLNSTSIYASIDTVYKVSVIPGSVQGIVPYHKLAYSIKLD